MHVNRQEARSHATRRKLIRSARTLFARRGYAGTPTAEIVRRAGVTRGALYHQFPSKEDLFLAVYEQVEQELTEGVVGALDETAGPLSALRAGAAAFLRACTAPEVQRIVLTDAPAVLGWERWREVAERYGLGLIENVVGAAIAAGEIAPLPASPLAHLLMGALDEAAMLVAREPDAAAQIAATLDRLLEGLRPPSQRRRSG
jgi:AcrR family transcriptional regulator